MTRYRTIVADPPWTPELGATWATRFSDKARPQAHYETMGLDGIKAVQPAATDQAHLWLWTLSQHMDWGYEVARAWGFEPAMTLTWCKPGLGVGRFQCNTEHVLICRHGSRHGNPFGKTGGTWFEWPRGRHSAKPDGFYDLVERVSPGPYLEMFARRNRLGWDTWGDESLGTAEMVAASKRRYHPNPVINAEAAADAIEAERADLAAGYPCRPWRCPRCDAKHDRGFFLSVGTHRCLGCGYLGTGGVLLA